MNFFKLFIGDYQRDTAHLTLAENGAYFMMLQHYYATQKPLPTGKALHRMLRAQDKTEREAIDSIAAQFWREIDGELINERAAKEIAKADVQADTNKRIATAREATRKAAREQHASCSNRVTNDQPNHSHSHSNTNPIIQTTTLAEIKNYAESTTYKENSPPTLTDIDKSESAIAKRAIEIVVLLHKAAPPINSASNPHVRQWAADGVSNEKLLAALDIARDNRYRTSSHQGINSGYLDSIINAPARAPPKPSKRLPVEDYATKDYGVSHDL
jgi:uncharacterized protein YdaU (DUF1376 family)